MGCCIDDKTDEKYEIPEKRKFNKYLDMIKHPVHYFENLMRKFVGADEIDYSKIGHKNLMVQYGEKKHLIFE